MMMRTVRVLALLSAIPFIWVASQLLKFACKDAMISDTFAGKVKTFDAK